MYQMIKRKSYQRGQKAIRRQATLDMSITNVEKETLLSICIQLLKKPLFERSLHDKKFIGQLVGTIDFFTKQSSGDETIIPKIVDCLQYQKLRTSQILCRQGEPGTRFYIILSGIIGVQIKLPDTFSNLMVSTDVNELHAGDAFGELALQDQTARTATCYAKSDCGIAYLEKNDYQQILGLEQQKKREAKIQFLGRYSFFLNWSLREIKTFAYHFDENNYMFNDKIFDQNDSSEKVYFIKEGNVELQKVLYEVVDPYQLNNHPFKNERKVQKIIPICFLSEGQIFGEDSFVENDQIQFCIKKESVIKELPQAKLVKKQSDESFSTISEESVAESQQKKLELNKITTNVKKRIYQAICKSKKVKLYIIKKEDIETRFFDPVTRTIFRESLEMIWEQRLIRLNQINNNVEQKARDISEVKVKKQIDLFKEAEQKRQYIQECKSKYETEKKQEPCEEKKESIITSSKLNKSEQFNWEQKCEQISGVPLSQKNTLINSQRLSKTTYNSPPLSIQTPLNWGTTIYSPNNQTKQDEFTKFIRTKMSAGQRYVLQEKESLEKNSIVNQKIDQAFSVHKKAETKAINEFTKLFLRMNQSYMRIKNLYEQRKLNGNRLFYQAFVDRASNRRNKTQHSPYKRPPQRLAISTNLNEPNKEITLHQSFDYVQYDTQSISLEEKFLQQELGQQECLAINQSTKNKYANFCKSQPARQVSDQKPMRPSSHYQYRTNTRKSEQIRNITLNTEQATGTGTGLDSDNNSNIFTSKNQKHPQLHAYVSNGQRSPQLVIMSSSFKNAPRYQSPQSVSKSTTHAKKKVITIIPTKTQEIQFNCYL